MTGYLDWGTAEERARRAEKMRGIQPNQFCCPDQTERFERRRREAERFWLDLGASRAEIERATARLRR